MKKQFILLIIYILLAGSLTSCKNEAAYKALIITGQGDHNWQASSSSLKTILETSGLFNAYVAVSPAKGGDMSNFNPKFGRYNVVVLDYNGDGWNDNTKKAFIDYVNNGGGVVVYRNSSGAFAGWKEYNEMCGLGAGGGRDANSGPYVYYRFNRMVYDSASGLSGTVGRRKDIEVRTRKMDHPVTKGLPARWMHADEEIIGRLRGPAKNMEILATAFADTSQGGPGRDEAVLMAITFGKGRVFNTTLGVTGLEGGDALKCAGFITTFQRGAEWAATGNVTQDVPLDFPTAAGTFVRPEFVALTLEEDFGNIVNYDIGKSTKYYTDLQARIRLASGDPVKLLEFEKLMVGVLKNSTATKESKKLMLAELSWIGSEYCVPAIKELATDDELKDAVDFALERLGAK